MHEKSRKRQQEHLKPFVTRGEGAHGVGLAIQNQQTTTSNTHSAAHVDFKLKLAQKCNQMGANLA